MGFFIDNNNLTETLTTVCSCGSISSPQKPKGIDSATKSCFSMSNQRYDREERKVAEGARANSIIHRLIKVTWCPILISAELAKLACI